MLRERYRLRDQARKLRQKAVGKKRVKGKEPAWKRLEGQAQREAFFAADVGVSGADYLIAETGTVVLATRPDQPRSLSLLPPAHVVVAHAGQIIPDLFDLPGLIEEPPACLSLITGPSKTGDIELRLVTGVHGPGELHVVLLTTTTPGSAPPR